MTASQFRAKEARLNRLGSFKIFGAPLILMEITGIASVYIVPASLAVFTFFGLAMIGPYMLIAGNFLLDSRLRKQISPVVKQAVEKYLSELPP